MQMDSSGPYAERSVQVFDMHNTLTDLSLFLSTVYSVVLDLNRKQACSGSMDGTVRVWNLVTGQCQHTLTGHTSLVGLLGLSPSFLVSAAADSTLRIWDPDTGELRHTLAAHTGAITCFQHDEFKVLSGSDGNLKMWNIRDGTVVRDLLTGITGVWQVVFEGRWCVAASNRNDTTVLDVWDFATDKDDDDWLGEPPSGLYDDDIFSEDEDSEDDEDDPKYKGLHILREDDDDVDQQTHDIAMDEDLVPSETDSIVEIELDRKGSSISREGSRRPRGSPEDVDIEIQDVDALEGMIEEEVEESQSHAIDIIGTTTIIPPARSAMHTRGAKTMERGTSAEISRLQRMTVDGAHSRSAQPSTSNITSLSSATRSLPSNDETPTRPRPRIHHMSRRK